MSWPRSESCKTEDAKLPNHGTAQHGRNPDNCDNPIDGRHSISTHSSIDCSELLTNEAREAPEETFSSCTTSRLRTRVSSSVTFCFGRSSAECSTFKGDNNRLKLVMSVSITLCYIHPIEDPTAYPTENLRHNDDLSEPRRRPPPRLTTLPPSDYTALKRYKITPAWFLPWCRL